MVNSRPEVVFGASILKMLFLMILSAAFSMAGVVLLRGGPAQHWLEAVLAWWLTGSLGFGVLAGLVSFHCGYPRLRVTQNGSVVKSLLSEPPSINPGASN